MLFEILLTKIFENLIKMEVLEKVFKISKTIRLIQVKLDSQRDGNLEFILGNNKRQLLLIYTQARYNNHRLK